MIPLFHQEQPGTGLVLVLEPMLGWFKLSHLLRTCLLFAGKQPSSSHGIASLWNASMSIKHVPRKPTEQCRTSSEGDLHTISCCQHEDFACGGCICTWLHCKSSGSSESLSGCPGRVVIQTSPSSAGRFPRPLGQWQKNSRYVCQQGQPGPKRWSRDGKSF